MGYTLFNNRICVFCQIMNRESIELQIHMEIIASHIKLLIPYVVVIENYTKVEITLISLQTGTCD